MPSTSVVSTTSWSTTRPSSTQSISFSAFFQFPPSDHVIFVPSLHTPILPQSALLSLSCLFLVSCRISLFLILSLSDTPLIALRHLISATSSFFTCAVPWWTTSPPHTYKLTLSLSYLPGSLALSAFSYYRWLYLHTSMRSQFHADLPALQFPS